MKQMTFRRRVRRQAQTDPQGIVPDRGGSGSALEGLDCLDRAALSEGRRWSSGLSADGNVSLPTTHFAYEMPILSARCNQLLNMLMRWYGRIDAIEEWLPCPGTASIAPLPPFCGIEQPAASRLHTLQIRWVGRTLWSDV